MVEADSEAPIPSPPEVGAAASVPVTKDGVVDPIRIPPWLREPFEQAWREAPTVARVFVVLAAIDLVSRGLGILQPRDLVQFDLFSIWLFLVPHGLWILLPAFLVLRRPDARQATPLVFWGAVVAALVMLLASPLRALFSLSDSLSALSLEVGIIASVGLAASWILIARGLRAVAAAKPNPTIAALSTLALGAELAAIVLGFGEQLANGAFSDNELFGDPSVNGLFVLDDLIGYAVAIAWLYLLWVVIRSAGDPRRPESAVLVGATAAGLIVAVDGISAVVGALGYATNGGIALTDLSFPLSFLRYGVAEAMLVVALAIGLADPPFALAPAAPSEPTPEGDAAALGATEA